MIKRTLDLVVASVALLALLPVMAVVALVVLVTMGRPVLFVQTRPGRGGRSIRVAKFRTMRNAHDRRGVPLPDSERLTKVGAWLRRSSLDELPQLFGVVRGDLSLVGPRPLLPEYIPLYSARQARRHEVRPGITGWAQVNGRNSISWAERLELDVWYVEHRSLRLDLRIIMMTLRGMLASGKRQFDGSVAMERFQGTPDGPAGPTRPSPPVVDRIDD